MRSIFCEDVSVTATKEDLGLLVASPSTRGALSLVSSLESDDFIKEDFKDLLVVGCGLGLDKQS